MKDFISAALVVGFPFVVLWSARWLLALIG